MSGEDLTLERVETWTLANLKEYVKKRGLPVSETKNVLAARAYVAWELQLPLIPMPATVAKEKRDHEERLLKTPEGDKPHPDNLKYGWLDEDQGISLWPPTMIQDIAVFLDRHSPSREHSFTHLLIASCTLEYKKFSSSFKKISCNGKPRYSTEVVNSEWGKICRCVHIPLLINGHISALTAHIFMSLHRLQQSRATAADGDSTVSLGLHMTGRDWRSWHCIEPETV